ncbi:hypothetical protein K440DRAFT_562246, partial [Wilcoxina mikolae CBS 423.85]
LSSLLSTPSGIDRLLNLIFYLATFLAPQLSRLALLLTIKLPTPIPLIVSDVRKFMRLWGLLGMYNWGMDTLRNPPEDPVVKGLVLAQVAVNTSFQVLENMAYLNKYAILSYSKKTEGWMWMWSTRCWAAHIVLEFFRLERIRRKARENWKKAWICNAANAPLSFHWSMEEGFISDTTIGLLGSIAGVIGLRDAWRNSA